MSQEIAKKALEEFISSDDKYCASLNGHWGMGKTYLVNEASKEYRKLYISMFELASVDELKRTIIADLSIQKGVVRGIYKKLRGTFKAISGTLKGWTHFDLSMVFTLTTNFISDRLKKAGIKLLIIDDIERAGTSNIRQLLGFIEKLKLSSDIKILLVLNYEELDDGLKKDWSRYKEKILDKEIVLSISPDEALDIANIKTDDILYYYLNDFASSLNISNIRLLERIRADVLYFTCKVPEMLHKKVVVSTAYFSSVFWGLYGDQTVEQLVDEHATYSIMINLDDGISDDIQERMDRMTRIIGYGYDVFESTILLQYFKYGAADEKLLSEWVAHKNETLREFELERKFAEYRRSFSWDPRLTSKEYKENVLLYGDEWCKFLNIRDISWLLDHIELDIGDVKLRNETMRSWISNNHNKIMELSQHTFDSKELNNSLKERVKEYLESNTPELTLFQAVMNIAGSKHGLKEKEVISSADKENFKSTLECIYLEDLRDFIITLNKLLLGREENHHYSSAREQYLAACYEIIEEGTRLGAILENAIRTK